MSDIREKLVTVESLKDAHDNNKKTYATRKELASTDNEINVLNTRVDNLIIESGGDSNSEVVDARIGADADAYDSAGTAIRKQFKEAFSVGLQNKCLNEVDFNKKNIINALGTTIHNNALKGMYSVTKEITYIDGTVDYITWSIPIEGLTEIEVPFEDSYPDGCVVVMLANDTDCTTVTRDAIINGNVSSWIKINGSTINIFNFDWWRENKGFTTLYITIPKTKRFVYVDGDIENYIVLPSLETLKTDTSNMKIDILEAKTEVDETKNIISILENRENALNEIRLDKKNIYSKGEIEYKKVISGITNTNGSYELNYVDNSAYVTWSIPIDGLTEIEVPFEDSYPEGCAVVVLTGDDTIAPNIITSNDINGDITWLSINREKSTLVISNLDWLKANRGYDKIFITVINNKKFVYVTDNIDNYIKDIPQSIITPQEKIIAYNQVRFIEDGSITIFFDNALYGADVKKYMATYADVDGCTDYIQMPNKIVIHGNGVDTNGAKITLNYCKENVHNVDFSKTISVYTVPKTKNAGNTKKILIIGDSWTAGAIWLHQLVSLFENDDMNIELLGTRPGGNTYVSGIYSGQEKPNHEGHSGWNAYAYCNMQSFNGTDNAFWNPNTESFDFSYYMQNQGYDSVDMVILALGMNGITVPVNNHYPTVSENTQCLAYMIESIKSYNEDIKIGTWLTPPPGQLNGGHMILEKDKRLSVNESIIETFGTSTYQSRGIYIIPTNIVFDTEWGYPVGLWYQGSAYPSGTDGGRLVSESLPTESQNSTEWHREMYHTEVKINSTLEAIHPNNIGYQQIANIVYAYIKLIA